MLGLVIFLRNGRKHAEYIFGISEAAKIENPRLSPASFNKEHSNKKYVLTSFKIADQERKIRRILRIERVLK